MPPRPTSRARLIAAAQKLFYGRGVARTTVDRIVEEAGLTKPTLYSAFDSKERLLHAALEERRSARQSQILERIGAAPNALAALHEMIEVHVEPLGRPGFRGCPLMVAAQEQAGSSSESETAGGFKEWVRSRIDELAREAGLDDPESFSWHLLLLIEGATVMAYLAGGAAAGGRLRVAAHQLLESSRRARSTRKLTG